jgi:hypothetical protein
MMSSCTGGAVAGHEIFLLDFNPPKPDGHDVPNTLRAQPQVLNSAGGDRDLIGYAEGLAAS